MKERTRRIDAETNRESDGGIVPKKQPNKANPEVAEVVEGRPPARRNTGEKAIEGTQSQNPMSCGLEGVRRKAKEDKTCCFTALLHHITLDLLRASFYELNRKAAEGIDGRSWEEYEAQLEERLPKLHEEIHKGSYRAQPVKRVYIPKTDGQKRPLGITAIEDKLVQQAVVTVLNQIYETEFYGFSYGYRPGRAPENALDALATAILKRPINWILDADLQKFFDSIPHDKLMALISIRVGDKRILRLIGKWLKTGYNRRRKTIPANSRHTAGHGDLATACQHLSSLRGGRMGRTGETSPKQRRSHHHQVRRRSCAGIPVQDRSGKIP